MTAEDMVNAAVVKILAAFHIDMTDSDVIEVGRRVYSEADDVWVETHDLVRKGFNEESGHDVGTTYCEDVNKW